MSFTDMWSKWLRKPGPGTSISYASGLLKQADDAIEKLTKRNEHLENVCEVRGKRRDHWKNVASKQEDEIAELMERNERLAEENLRLSESDSSGELEKLREKVSLLVGARETYFHEIAHLRTGRVKELEEANKHIRIANEGLSKEMANLWNSNGRLKEFNDRLKEANDGLKRELNVKALELHELEEKFAGSFQGKAEELRESLAKMVDAIVNTFTKGEPKQKPIGLFTEEALNGGWIGFDPGHGPDQTDARYVRRQNEKPRLTITDLVRDAHQNAINKGWYEEPRSFGESIALIHSELSEALEDHRNGKGLTEVWYEHADTYVSREQSELAQPKPCGIPSELADVVIRVADLCGHLGVDLEAAINEKMAYNATRPHRHGGKKL